MASSIFVLPAVPGTRRDWTARSLRSIVKSRVERNRPELPLLTVARERGVFVRSPEDDNHNAIPEDLSNYKVARKGDLVINKMKAWQGSLGLAPVDGIVSPAYFVFETDFAVPRFGEYLLRSRPYVTKFGAASDGVRVGQWDLNIPRMRSIEVLLPPPDEQATIVKYLAHANARIDKAIAAKRRLITLLREEQDVETTQLMQVEGAPLVRTKDVCIRIVDCKNRTPDYVEGGGFHVVRTSCVRSGVFSMEGSYETDQVNFAKWTQRGAPSAGDVLFTREAPAGEAALVPEREDLCLGQRMMYFRPDPSRVISEYLLLAIYAEPARRFVSVATNGSTVGHLRVGDVGALPLFLPSLDEQRRIVAHHRTETKAIRRTIDRVLQEIDLLSEFRARLVADVVTGQVDVRWIADSLPEIDVTASWDHAGGIDGADLADSDDVLEAIEV